MIYRSGALTERWRAGPGLRGNRAREDTAFLVSQSADWADSQPTMPVGHLGLEKNIEAPGPSGLGGKGWLVLLNTEHKTKEIQRTQIRQPLL